jgi:glycosyltransferase involved in cell wall biosynthesis
VQFGKINFPFEAWFLSRLKRGGLVLTQICHEFERRESSGALARYFDRLYASIYRSFSAMFFHANQNRERFHAIFDIPREGTFVIHHGNENLFLDLASGLKPSTNLREQYGITANEPVILFFGLIAPSKGLPLLLEAFELIAARSKAKLVIAGYPAKQMDMRLLHEQAAASATPERIIFDTRYIPLEEVAPLMRLADVVVFPYQSSTQSGSLQIAYSFGRPVVATNVGGLVETVEEGKTGFLVPPDDPNLMAERVLSILNDPRLAAEMGQYSKLVSETRFSWKIVAQTVGGVYRSLLPEKSA